VADTQELPVPGDTGTEPAEEIQSAPTREGSAFATESMPTSEDSAVAAEPADAEEPLAAPESPGHRAKYEGEGVYVGNEPPEGYSIKGNERSMKYHVPESGGYGRTTAEVWFNSEEAAQRAGFVRAQR
jgi:hypothetical protein